MPKEKSLTAIKDLTKKPKRSSKKVDEEDESVHASEIYASIDKRKSADDIREETPTTFPKFAEYTEAFRHLDSSFGIDADDLNEEPTLDDFESAVKRLLRLQGRFSRSRITSLQRELEREQEEKRQHINTIHKLESKIDSLNKEMSDREAAHQAELKQLHNRFNELKRRNATVESQLETFTRKLKLAKEQIANKDEKIVKASSKKKEETNTSSNSLMAPSTNEKLLLLEEKSQIGETLIQDLLSLDSLESDSIEISVTSSTDKLIKPSKSSNEPQKDEIQQMIDETKANDVREIEVTPGLPISLDQIESFAHALADNSSVVSLRFNRNQLGDNGIKLIVEALKSHKNVHSLCFESCQMGIEGLKHVFQLFQENSTIKSLNISGNLLNQDKQFISLLTNFLTRDYSQLSRLHLGGNAIGPQGLKDLVPAFEKNSSISWLEISGNFLGSEGSVYVQDIINKCENIQVLNVWGNLLGSAKEIFNENLNMRLKTLILKGNNLREEGAKNLAEVLDRNTSLTVLDISGNSLGCDGLKTLSHSLKNSKTIVDLNLGGNSLGDESMTYISDIIGGNSSITSLNLELNLIDDAGAKALCQALLHNKTLENLDLGWNRIGEEGARALHSHLSSFMKSLVFHGNGLTQVNDLCQVGENYFEDSKAPPSKIKKMPSAAKFDPQRAFAASKTSKQNVSMGTLFGSPKA